MKLPTDADRMLALLGWERSEWPWLSNDDLESPAYLNGEPPAGCSWFREVQSEEESLRWVDARRGERLVCCGVDLRVLWLGGTLLFGRCPECERMVRGGGHCWEHVPAPSYCRACGEPLDAHELAWRDGLPKARCPEE